MVYPFCMLFGDATTAIVSGGFGDPVLTALPRQDGKTLGRAPRREERPSPRDRRLRIRGQGPSRAAPPSANAPWRYRDKGCPLRAAGCARRRAIYTPPLIVGCAMRHLSAPSFHVLPPRARRDRGGRTPGQSPNTFMEDGPSSRSRARTACSISNSARSCCCDPRPRAGRRTSADLRAARKHGFAEDAVLAYAPTSSVAEDNVAGSVTAQRGATTASGAHAEQTLFVEQLGAGETCRSGSMLVRLAMPTPRFAVAPTRR